MLNIIVVSATRFEIAPTLQFLDTFSAAGISVSTYITNAGMVNTAFELGRLAGHTIDIAINAGIAGSFGKYNIGDVVQVNSDCFSELGAEDDERFISMDELGFGQQRTIIQNPLLNDFTVQVPQATGITVNTVHGNEHSIKKIAALHKADVETMEGAAFIHAANALGWRAIQLRAISNNVEKRNKDAWDIPLAVKNLNKKLIELIESIEAAAI